MSKRTNKRKAERDFRKEIEEKSEWQQADIELDLEWEDMHGKPKKETLKLGIIHNLPNIRGMSIEDALENWKVRTEEHTSQSFCDYINSKSHMTNCRAMTVEQYKKLSGGKEPEYLD